MPSDRDREVEPPDWLLTAVLRGRLFLVRRVVPYGWLLKKWTATGRKSRDFAPTYVLAWLLAVAVAYAFSPLWVGTWAGALAIVVAGWRYVDLMVWYLGLLIDPRHTGFAPVERNVLSLILDLLTLTLFGAILLRATDSSLSIDTAWFDAFFLVTLTDVPTRSDFWDGIVQVVVLSGGLLLIVGGLAIILSVVAKRFRQGPHRGPTHARHD